MNPITQQHSRRLLIVNGSAPQPHVKTPERAISVGVAIIIMVTLICTLLISLIFNCFRRRRRSIQPPPITSSHSDKLAALPTFIYYNSASASCSSATASSSSLDSETICAICLAEFVHGEEVRVLPKCNHLYHKDCIDQWLVVRSLRCPICRDRTIEGDVEPTRTRCTSVVVGDPSMFLVLNFSANHLQ